MKQRKFRFFTVAATLIIAGCGMHIDKKTGVSPQNQSAPGGGTNPRVSFQQVKITIIEPYCVRCHSAGGKASDLPFSTLTELMQTGTIKEGDAEASSFYQMIDTAQMPPRQPRLADELITNVATWINQGARE